MANGALRPEECGGEAGKKEERISNLSNKFNESRVNSGTVFVRSRSRG